MHSRDYSPTGRLEGTAANLASMQFMSRLEFYSVNSIQSLPRWVVLLILPRRTHATPAAAGRLQDSPTTTLHPKTGDNDRGETTNSPPPPIRLTRHRHSIGGGQSRVSSLLSPSQASVQLPSPATLTASMGARYIAAQVPTREAARGAPPINLGSRGGNLLVRKPTASEEASAIKSACTLRVMSSSALVLE